jgi:rifampicin phosphotransferase
MEWIRPLEGLNKGDLALAGGKGANLGAMVQAGLPVPPGFVVLTDAYRLFVQQAGIQAEIERLAAGVDPGDMVALEAASARIRALFDQGAVPPEIAAAMATAYTALEGGPVAVRSSATAEDLPDASFAGQQETYLNIQGAGPVAAAVRRCWSSLWTGRALAYRVRSGIAPGDVALAVVVQQLVPADSAGVLFTADPLSGRRDHMVINGAWGLGESVVSGTVSPDHWLADGQTGSIISERVAAKTVMTARTESGSAEQPVPAELVHKPVLDAQQVAALVQLGRQAAAYFGAPQDLEWALTGGQFCLLQSRPITTLPDLDELPALSQGRRKGRSSEQIRERFPVAPRPLDTVVVDLLGSAVGQALVPIGLKVTEPGTAGPVPVWRTEMKLPKIRPTLKLLGIFQRIGALSRQDLMGWWEQGPQPALMTLSQTGDLTALSDQELRALADRILESWRALFGQRMAKVVAMAISLPLHLLVMLAVGRRRAAAVSAALLMGVPTKTTEANEALWRLSRLVRAEPGSAAVQREFKAFLAAYGHREGATWYLSEPTWRQDPGRVWTLIRSMAEVADAPMSGGAGQFEAAYALVGGRLRRWPGLARRFADLVQRNRALYAFRENSHFDLTRPLDALQAIAAEWGRRLVERGLLRQPADVFYLTHDDVQRWLSDEHPPAGEAYALIARRRATYRVANSRWQGGEKPSAPTGNELRGVGASGGKVRGRARVVQGEEDFGRLRPGEVLVCPYTNPAWTPLFAAAAAVVAQTGGAISHAAIVAREYQIPAVMGVAGALERIQDGQELLVDGDRGVVILLPAPM